MEFSHNLSGDPQPRIIPRPLQWQPGTALPDDAFTMLHEMISESRSGETSAAGIIGGILAAFAVLMLVLRFIVGLAIAPMLFFFPGAVGAMLLYMFFVNSRVDGGNSRALASRKFQWRYGIFDDAVIVNREMEGHSRHHDVLYIDGEAFDGVKQYYTLYRTKRCTKRNESSGLLYAATEGALQCGNPVIVVRIYNRNFILPANTP